MKTLQGTLATKFKFILDIFLPTSLYQLETADMACHLYKCFKP